MSGAPRLLARKVLVSSLARLSLLAAATTMLPGCLVDDPPPYTEPKRTPPRLVYHRAQPPPYLVIVARTPDLIRFTIPVASEDAGEGLRAQLFVDDTLVNYSSLPPATLDDPPREVAFTYAVRNNTITSGCHRFKIRVGHESTLPDGDSAPRDLDDLAEVYWLSYINVPAEGGTDECATQP